MKKLLIVCFAAFILMTSFTLPSFASDEISVIINGTKIESDVPAQTLSVYDASGEYVGDRVMLPIRAVSEALNCDVHWNEATEGITIYRKANFYIMWLGKETAFHLDELGLENGYTMDVPPVNIAGRTLVPVRAVAELLGAEVQWNGDTKSVEIACDLGVLEDNANLAEDFVLLEELLNDTYSTYDKYVRGTLEMVKGKIVLENGNEINFELYPEIAPLTCENFIRLAKDKFYDNTIFHRVIQGFVAQGGGFDLDGTQKEVENVPGEFLSNNVINFIPHDRGAISLARAKDPDSGNAQFFIVQEDSPHLDGEYAAFGKVTDEKSMAIVDEICAVETDYYDKPLTPVIVKEIIIED